MTLNGFSEASNGGGGGRPREVRRVAVLLTASRSTVPNKTVSSAARARDAGVTMIVVGVGKNLCPCELKAIASEPVCRNLVVVEDAAELETLTHAIRHRVRQGAMLFTCRRRCVSAGVS